jgi:hypothetical protein
VKEEGAIPLLQLLPFVVSVLCLLDDLARGPARANDRQRPENQKAGVILTLDPAKETRNARLYTSDARRSDVSNPSSKQYQTAIIVYKSTMESMTVIPKNMSTMSLERRLRQLRDESQKLDQVLTQKLASSQSGQNLLHIGTSLSSLPPDLHSLLQHLHPVLSQAESAESDQLELLRQLVQSARDIQVAERRVQYAQDCADLYADLMAAEACIQSNIGTTDKYSNQRPQHVDNETSSGVDASERLFELDESQGTHAQRSIKLVQTFLPLNSLTI